MNAVIRRVFSAKRNKK